MKRHYNLFFQFRSSINFSSIHSSTKIIKCSSFRSYQPLILPQRIKKKDLNQSFHTTACNLQNDEYYMRQALSLADEASKENEVPIGAILVDEKGTILATGKNCVESQNDCTCHAEMVCLRNAMSKQSNWRLMNTTLYCTLEPCAMCLSALALARVSNIVYAAPDLRLGACGTWIDLITPSHPFHNFNQIRHGILAEESAERLRSFFRNRRLEPSRYPNSYHHQT